MEPVRPGEGGRFRRRSRPQTSEGTSLENEGFRHRLDTVEGLPETGDVSEPGGLSDTAAAALSGLPGVDAPTEKLFDAVHQAGQRLLDERTYTAAQHYREAIRRFLGKVLHSANSLEVHESNRNILSRKRYFLLTEINQSVDRLLKGLNQSQARQLEILSRLEEIEGLLVNLFY